jgi:hypothetical protein
MRAMTDADVAAIRSAFDSVLAALPQDRLRTLILELMFAPLTMTTPLHPHRRRGRPRKDVEEGNVVPLQRKTARRRRKGAVDENKLIQRRKRAAANRRAKRQAARAAKAIKAAAPAAAAGNGQDAISAEAFWRHAEKIEPKAPWKPVMRDSGPPRRPQNTPSKP